MFLGAAAVEKYPTPSTLVVTIPAYSELDSRIRENDEVGDMACAKAVSILINGMT